MITIVAGSRSCNSYDIVAQAIEYAPWKVTTIVSGCAPGVDRLGEDYANNKDIALLRMPANWSRYGQGAGKIRNIEMALAADALVAIWDGYSPGTGHMIDTARVKGLKIYAQFFDIQTNKIHTSI